MPTPKITLTGELLGSSHQFEKELALVPSIVLQEQTQYLTLKYGVRGKVTLGELDVTGEFSPYKTAKGETGTATINPRTLETYHGDIVTEVDPVDVYESCYTEPLNKGRISLDVVKKVMMKIGMNASEKLAENLFVAARNSSGTTTADLFDGFSTIAANEIANSTMTTALGNYADLGQITPYNCGDVLLRFYRQADIVLKKKQNLYMYIPTYIKEAYEDWFAQNFESAPYNNQFEKTILHGTSGRVQLIDLVGLDESDYIFLTTKDNMIVGCDGTEDGMDTAQIRACDNPKVVQYFAETFIGCNFKSIHARNLKVGAFTFTENPEPEPEPEPDPDNQNL